MSTFAKIADLPLVVESYELEPLEFQASPEFTRLSTVIRLRGGGHEGVGEDVTYDALDHIAQQDAGPVLDLAGEHTLFGFGLLVGDLDLFPAPPVREVSRLYRRWAFESAALDLALRQANVSLAEALRIEPRPVTFVTSFRLGDPPSMEPVKQRLELYPDLRFKLDPTNDWTDELIAELAATDAVDVLDLKGHYKGTPVDVDTDPVLYGKVAKAFPKTWLEDPDLNPETDPVLAPFRDRITWDAPIHSIEDIEALSSKPTMVNIKPSRFGGLRALFDAYDWCVENDVQSYGGGQWELGPGRGQIQYLASLFHPDAPNDTAPSAYNEGPKPGLPTSPLAPAPSETGFRWGAPSTPPEDGSGGGDSGGGGGSGGGSGGDGDSDGDGEGGAPAAGGTRIVESGSSTVVIREEPPTSAAVAEPTLRAPPTPEAARAAALASVTGEPRRLSLAGALRRVPATPALLLAVVVFAVLAADEGGYPPTVWYPAAILLTLALAVAVIVLRPRIATLQRPVLVAIAALAGFTAWSYASIAWADAQGDALDGANRTLFYLVAFALFALWAQRGQTAALVMGAWTLALIGIAGYWLVKLSIDDHPLRFFTDDRLVEPAGYQNAAPATWLMAVWPALLLAARREVPWPLRGLFAGGIVVLADLALLSQSRGSLFALPIVLVVYFAIVPARVRSFAVLAPAAIAIGATTPILLHAGKQIRDHAFVASDLTTATEVALGAAVLVAVLVAGAGWLERSRPPSPELAARGRRAIAFVGVSVAILAVIGGLIAAGQPGQRVDSAWKSFKNGYGDSSNSGSRLTSGLGSNRYDFYRVALDEFAEHPVTGIGADNFAIPYLVRGRSGETPRYPHSIEFRTLSQTGIVGALLLLVALVAALWGAARAIRRGERFVACLAGAGVAVFAYWFVHGSADWLYEFAGLGAPAFAMLGLACALAPRPVTARPGAGPQPDAGPRAGGGRGARLALIAGVTVAALAAVVVLGAPWLSARYTDRAVSDWPQDPKGAFADLDRAADLNPLSDRPLLAGGTIALRLGELGRARSDFQRALGRKPRGAYAALQLGAIASAQRQRDRAERLLALAADLNPRDPATKAALRAVRAGRTISIPKLEQLLVRKPRALRG